MLQERTFAGTKKEHAAVAELLVKLNVATASVTRAEPDEKGPLRVEAALPDGTVAIWHVNANGSTKETT